MLIKHLIVGILIFWVSTGGIIACTSKLKPLDDTTDDIVIAPITVEEIAEGLESPDPVDRRQAIERISWLFYDPHSTGRLAEPLENYLPALLPSLKDSDIDVRYEAVEMVGIIGGKTDMNVTPYLKLMLNDSDLNIRREAASALGNLGSRAFEAVPALIVRLHLDKTNYDAIIALGKIGPAAVDAVPDLLELLNDRHLYTRTQAALSLVRIGHGETEALAALIGILEEESASESEKTEALWVLTEMGHKAEPAVPVIVYVANNTDQHIFLKSAIPALGAIGSPEGVPFLVEMLDDSYYRLHAVKALAQVGPCTPEVVPALIQMLDVLDDESVNREAVTALAKVSGESEQAVVALRQVLENQDNQAMKRDAITALVELGSSDPKNIPTFVKALRDVDYFIRVRAAEGLGQFGPAASEAVFELTQALQSENEEFAVRYAAAQSLGKIGPAAMLATPDLINYMAEEDAPWAQEEIALALQSITGQDFGSNIADWQEWWTQQVEIIATPCLNDRCP